MVVARGEGLGVGEMGKGGQGYKLPVVRWICYKDVMHSMMAIANNTVLYIWKFLRE